jgi:DNA-binding FrmR family transcriptional regulator
VTDAPVEADGNQRFVLVIAKGLGLQADVGLVQARGVAYRPVLVNLPAVDGESQRRREQPRESGIDAVLGNRAALGRILLIGKQRKDRFVRDRRVVERHRAVEIAIACDALRLCGLRSYELREQKSAPADRYRLHCFVSARSTLDHYRIPPYIIWMSHTIKNKSRLVGRVRRIKGQIEAVERALEAELGCADVLMLVASVRGAVNGLTAELLEDHIRHHVVDPAHEQNPQKAKGAADLIDVVRTYLK